MQYVQDGVKGARVLVGAYGDTVLVIALIIAALGVAVSLVGLLGAAL